MRSARKRKQAGLQPLQEANVAACFEQWRFDWPAGGPEIEADLEKDEDSGQETLDEISKRIYGNAGRPRGGGL
eukprot:533593-Lingulodinium_polyedra.AAC.1